MLSLAEAEAGIVAFLSLLQEDGLPWRALGKTLDGKANWAVMKRVLAYLPQWQTGEREKTPEVANFPQVLSRKAPLKGLIKGLCAGAGTVAGPRGLRRLPGHGCGGQAEACRGWRFYEREPDGGGVCVCVFDDNTSLERTILEAA